MEELLPEAITELEDFLDRINSWIDTHKSAKALKLKSRFLGPLGEAYALIELNKFLRRRRYNFVWKGGVKKGADIIISSEKKEAYFQIKTSPTCSFSVISFELPKGFRKLMENAYDKKHIANFKLPPAINDEFDRQFNEKFVTDSYYWIFVAIGKKDNIEYYIFKKSEMRQMVKKDYSDFVAGKHMKKDKRGDDFNFAIDKQKRIRIIIHKEFWENEFSQAKNRQGWEKIKL